MKKAFIFGDKTLDEAVKRVNSLRKIAVIGAGTMGQGIAIDLLRRTECEVVLLDVSKDALDKAIARLESGWAREVKGAMIRQEDMDQFRSRVSCTDSYEGLSDCDVIWEVATEDANIKAKIFASIEAVADGDKMAAIFSNTSSHTTEELAELFTKASFREKFLTVHGYFPFEGNRLIDVMKGKYASLEAFRFGVVFADQILEKKVVALEVDHHGYLTDPIFQGMGAIVSWDVKTGDDIVQLGGLWELFTANPFSVLDHTGHMPYTESSKHLGQALPKDDRLRSLYSRDGLYYPTWIGELELAGSTGANSKDRKGFYQLNEKRRAEGVFDPASGKYVPICEMSRDDYWSYFEAANKDRANGKIKSADGLVHVACSDDLGGKAFRKYALPICLYCLDMVQDGFATAGQVNTCTRAGLRFKVGIIELVDAMIRELGIDGL
ncbi:MAG: 3-hydroxyacyl-CoA dehydrogenase NAD-binding domain-containing protein, partial [Phycisphaerales bacterium]|nr:3-hydroxyacyl-CoA dehydrogenase NAD-binding domain-containing protein [Phycisphaerales bacterium]